MKKTRRSSLSSFPKKKLARILVRPPTRPSSGAQFIKSVYGLGAKLSRLVPVPRQYNVVINWGNPSEEIVRPGLRVINAPSAVRTAIDKLLALRRMQEYGVRVPEFVTEAPKGAKDIWLARTNLRGSGGDGIVVVRAGGTFPQAPLYTRYIRKLQEVRCHVAFGEVIFTQEKRRKSENQQTEDQKLIRNYDNGWVFCPVDTGTLSEDHKTQAIKAIESLGLDFGAVDMVISKKESHAYVLEVNTAPGIESPTLKEAYTRAFGGLANG